MTSKSPVRSCEDVDEASLSYAEIKALCAGNPLIKERMDLEIDVSRLRVLKAEYQSQHYHLEDNLLKYYPESIERDKGYIAGFESDMRLLDENTPKAPENIEITATEDAAAPAPTTGDSLAAGSSAEENTKDADKGKQGEPFPSMVINGVAHADKGKAGAALLEACKLVESAAPIPIGTYRGFDMSLKYSASAQAIELTLKGAMRHSVNLGSDAYRNITRINNTLAEIPERLQSTKVHLDGLYRQMEEAKLELAAPFQYEQELTEKTARLALLDAELNIGGKTFEVLDDSQETPDTAIGEEPEYDCADEEQESAKSAKPSIMDRIKAIKENLAGVPEAGRNKVNPGYEH